MTTRVIDRRAASQPEEEAPEQPDLVPPDVEPPPMEMPAHLAARFRQIVEAAIDEARTEDAAEIARLKRRISQLENGAMLASTFGATRA